MKIATATLVAGLIGSTANAQSVEANVQDIFTTTYQEVPYTQRECVDVEIPVYSERYRQGNAAEGAILGMIIGGIGGKAITGQNNGAAAGAVIGGMIGADRAQNSTTTQRVITGYRTEERCTNVTRYRREEQVVYDYSIITFSINGEFYEFTFTK